MLLDGFWVSFGWLLGSFWVAFEWLFGGFSVAFRWLFSGLWVAFKWLLVAFRCLMGAICTNIWVVLCVFCACFPLGYISSVFWMAF